MMNPMLSADLILASGVDSLSVRRVIMRERMSDMFRVDVEATSPNEDIDLESIVGQPAEIRVRAATSLLAPGGRRWAGVCSRMAQVQAEAAGLSIYVLRIEPRLWFLTQRTNHRLFQHLSIPDIAGRLLGEWQIEHMWRVDRAQYPKLELRVQYGESDYAFLCRLLEEAGIAFHFQDEGERGPVLVLDDKAELADPRAGGPIRHVDNPSVSPDGEYVTKVALSQEVRPGKHSIRDHDFRRGPDAQLFAEASDGAVPEHRLEQYRYLPGAFLVEGARGGGTPVADDKGAARHDERAGKVLATRSLEASRASRRVVSLETNVLELRPGMVFSMARHPRGDLAEDKKLVVTAMSLEGAAGEVWRIAGEAVFADGPYRPAKTTPKPQIHSVQSAVVVGPRGEEIYTDEYGRVRVQFPWDREGKHDDHSSCWMRVSQGWAGTGFGLVAIPRVGQEVLVGFLGGDPDAPVVVGRLYNGTAPVPYKLPENKAVSGWKTASTPGAEGYNELRFEDGKGSELVHLQAERNLTKLVKVDEMETTGSNRTIQVGKRLVLTTGEASIVLDGPTLSIEAKGGIQVKSTKGDVVLEGGPKVMINPVPPEAEEEMTEEQIQRAEARIKRWRKKVGFGTEPFRPGIEIRGTPEFREHARDTLLALAKTRMGRALFRKMTRTEHTATVVETTEPNGGCRAESIEDAKRQPDGSLGKGTGSTVFFNPSFASEDLPKEVVLGYGLIRAWQNAKGVREARETGGVMNDVLRAIGLAPYSVRGCTENNLRRNLGLQMRKTH